MKISVIIPSHNQQEYICEAIESALANKPYEIIVVDDGSTDNSLEIARKYEPKIKVISQVNKGLSSARNTGIMNATGEYIFPLDADDMMKDTCLEVITKAIEKTNADIVAPSFKCFGVSNDTVILLAEPILEDFYFGNRLGYFSAVRRSKLLDIGGYSPKMVWGWEDLHLWINLLKVGATLKTLPDVLMMYRTKENSMIHEANKHAEELLAQIKKDFPNT